MSDVFISYAREDQPFVERLAQELKSRSLDLWVDVDGLFVGENFWDRICAEIDGANVLVSVVSTHSARSRFCRREAEYAATHSKRIVPVVIDAVRPDRYPEPIQSLHWLSFTRADHFEESIEALLGAVQRDLDWVRYHTRLLGRSTDWDSRGRPASACLRGEELSDAVAWLSRASGKEPPPNDLQSEFIRASQREESRGREEAERRARVSTARSLTSQAELLRTRPGGRSLVPALLAAEALRLHTSADAQAVLCRALALLPRYLACFQHEFRVGAVCLSPDGTRLATAAGMSLEQEQNREWSRSADGPSLEDVDEYSDGIRRLAQERESGQAEAFAAFVWETDAGRELVRLPHGGRVLALAFTPDGENLATASDDGQATIWSVPSGRRITSFSHPGPVWLIRVSPDGSRLISIAEEDANSLGELKARVWEVPAGKETTQVSLGGFQTGASSLSRELSSFAIGASAERMAAAFHDGSIRLWSLVDGRLLATRKHPSAVHCMAFSDDGTDLALGDDEAVRIVRLSDGRVTTTLPHDAPVGLIRWSPDGSRLVTAAGIGSTQLRVGLERPLCSTVQIWERGGSRVDSFEHSLINDVTFSPDSEVVAVAGSGPEVRVRDARGRRGDVAHLHFEDQVNAVTFSGDGSRLAAAADDLTARVWEATFGLEVLRRALEDAASEVKLSADGRVVAVAGPSRCQLLDVATGEPIGELPGKCEGVALSSDGALLAARSDGGLRLWRRDPDESVKVKQTGVQQMLLSPDGSRLVALGTRDIGKGTARIWDTSTGRSIAEVKHGDVPVGAIRPDGKAVASAGGPYYGHDVVISRLDDGKTLAHVQIAEPVNDLAFSPDGRFLAVAYDQLGLYLFESRRGRQLAHIGGGNQAVAFSPDGGQLVAAREHWRDGRPYAEVTVYDITDFSRTREAELLTTLPEQESPVRLNYLEEGAYLSTIIRAGVSVWDVAGWQEIARYEGPYISASFSLKGGLVAFLAPVDGARELRVLPWRPEDLLEEARKRLTRSLTRDEWDRYVGDMPYRESVPDEAE